MVSLKQVDTYLVNVNLSEHPLIELNFKALQMIISFSPLNKKFSTLDLSSGCMTKRHITLKKLWWTKFELDIKWTCKPLQNTLGSWIVYGVLNSTRDSACAQHMALYDELASSTTWRSSTAMQVCRHCQWVFCATCHKCLQMAKTWYLASASIIPCLTLVLNEDVSNSRLRDVINGLASVQPMQELGSHHSIDKSLKTEDCTRFCDSIHAASFISTENTISNINK